MRYSDSSDLSKVSLLSLTLLIFSAGIVEVINPYPTRAASLRAVDSLPTLLLAQSTPPVNPPINSPASPQATSSPVSAEPSNREGGDNTLWWLLFLCVGLPFVLAWLGSKGKNTTVKPSTLILTPETGQIARIYWEIPPEKIQRLRRQGGTNLAVRLTDVTNINPQVTNPKVVQQVSCSLGSPLISVQVPEVDREYAAELGCVTNDGGWLSLAKSAPAYFPAPRPFLGGLGAGIVTAIGSNEIGSFDTPSETQEKAILPQVADKVDLIKNSLPPVGVAGVIDNPTIIAEEAENTEVIDNSAGSLEADIWDEQVPLPVTTPITTNADNADNAEIVESGIAHPSHPEDLPLEEVTTPLSSVVPTVDDGDNRLNWGVIGGVAAAGVSQVPKDEVVIDTPLPMPLEVKTQIRLDRYTSDQGYVTWTIASGDSQILKSQEIKDLRLRIHDVTDIELDHTPAHNTQEYVCEMDQGDRHVTIIVGDRPHADYIAELGSMTNTGEWLRIIRSLHTRFFS